MFPGVLSCESGSRDVKLQGPGVIVIVVEGSCGEATDKAVEGAFS